MKMRLLDLFCGAGGAAMGYHRAGFEVVGIDIKPQPHYPFEFHQADAMMYPLEGFDVIHASPPCQRFSRLTPDKAVHFDLITPTRERVRNKIYIIENVVGAPLRDPIMLCGSSFGLRVRRHRLFESNISLEFLPCAHWWQDQSRIFRVRNHGEKWTGVCYVFGSGGCKARDHWEEAMGIDWMISYELTQAIPPAYTEYIGKQLLETLA